MGDHAPKLHGGESKAKPKAKRKTAEPKVNEPIPDEADDGNGAPIEETEK